jgi:cyclopropane-fatty-acyl-phospholipid synthase
MARRIILSRLEGLQHGQIVISEGGRHFSYGRLTDEMPLTAHIEVDDVRFYSDIAFGGAIGAGESWIHGHWRCDELTFLTQILLRNRHVLDSMNSGAARLTRPLQKLFHWMHRNSRNGSRRNIAAHYDLGNDFYSLWLDETMMYSAAFFESADASLNEASTAKLDRICRKLDLKATDSLIEIGTGWGGFAVHAARHYGCRVTTTTISRRQYEYAKDRIRREGLEDRITLLLDDYRDLSGSFDKLVSIEMIEAVGHEYHDQYFRKCAALLKPDGQMLLQAITIDDQRYDSYRKGVDFIKRYIFPGGCLTSITSMAKTLTQATDMRVFHLEDIGSHYATTLERWRGRFFDRIDEVRGLGFTDEFIRMWEFYLCYCEGAFRERAISNVQLLIARPNARPETICL